MVGCGGMWQGVGACGQGRWQVVGAYGRDGGMW